MGEVHQITKPPRKIYRDQLVTISDLEDFKQDLLLSLSQLIKSNIEKPQKKWLKSYEVRKLLGISDGTLINLRANGTIPYTRIGKIIFYDQEQINKIIVDKLAKPFQLKKLTADHFK